MGVGGWWYLYRTGWLASLRKRPRYPSRVSGDRVRDRRDSVRTPIPTKSRTTRSARRALRSYLTAVTFRQHLPATLKIIRLLNRRGFPFRWLRLVSRGCDGARVNPGVAKVVCRGGKGRSRIRYENTRGKYSPIIISAKQTPQTSQTNCTTTQ